MIRARAVGSPHGVAAWSELALVSVGQLVRSHTQLHTLDLASVALCGVDGRGAGVFTSRGVELLCAALPTSAVRRLDVSSNCLCGVSVYGRGDFSASALHAVRSPPPRILITLNS